ncbi:uncharacterized protein LOC135219966 isoform X2 [Macrobrachium nipponense]|uniref:uncharacterized protein LOC135219966 isoform X2 n=1 Tax=Macrobrachium nipponense TaxID=159736 RepID=UPI0030C8827E
MNTDQRQCLPVAALFIREQIREVPIYGKGVAPGYYYDDKTQYISPAKDVECIQTKTIGHVKFDIQGKNIVKFLAKGVSKAQTWAKDYVKENPHDVMLIKGSKILEKRALEVPRDSERWRVLSVLHKYHADLLICFSEEISKDLLEIFKSHLNSIVNNAECSVLPQSFVNKFQSGYVYPQFLGPGIRFEKLMYGINEFCSLVQNAKVSTVPVSARVKAPCVRLANDKFVSSQEPVSDELKSNLRPGLNVVSRTESNASSSEDNLPKVHFDENQKKVGIGHGVTKSNVMKSETVNTPGQNVGRGRGTMTGRGKSIVAPGFLNDKDTRIKNAENRTREPVEVALDREMQKLQNSLGKEEKSFNEKYEERKEIGMGSDRTYRQPVWSNSSCGSYHQNKDCRASHYNGSERLRGGCGQVSTRSPSNQVIVQEEIQKDRVFHEATSFSQCDLANGEATATNVVECSKKLEDNAKKPDSDTLKLENILSEDSSSPKNNSVEKSESGAQKSNKSKKTSVPESEFSRSSVHKPDVNTRGLVKKEMGSGTKLHELNDTKPERNAGKSENTKKVTTSRAVKKKEVTAKEHTSNNRVLATAQKFENAPKNVDPKKVIKNGNVKTWNTAETEKCKNPKKEANPKKELLEDKVKNQGKNTTNVTQNKQKLYQGFGCDDEDEESSLLKISNQKICTGMRSNKCKEQLQMKSTFLEATQTHDDLILGFQRKYYGVVNDSSLEKVILLLGASGSGKTTLINLAANYFKEKKDVDEGLYHVVPTSPTSNITAYTFCSAIDEIPITIIDTPGLNDSSGAELQEHVQALKTFLANASANDFQIHAIGFVAQAYLVRLTSSERLVMDYVSSLFGRGVKDHLVTLVTFADNQDSPPVVEAMKNYGVDFKLSLKFNNSALHNSKVDDVDDIDRVYWRVCWRNWKKCLKVLRDLPPLSASTMKAVQSEVFASTVLKSAERNLRVSLRAFFAISEEDRIMSKEASEVCAEIWNLAAVLQHFKGLNVSHGGILAEFAREICKTQKKSPEENVFFLSLNRENPLVVSGLEVMRIMAPVYKEAKTWHKESNSVSRNVTLWTYCHNCMKEHTMKREASQGFFKKLTGPSEEVLLLKCNECKCLGEVHGVCKTKSPFHPDEVLSRTCAALRKIIAQYSISNFPVSEFWFLKFLIKFSTLNIMNLFVRFSII